MFRKYDTISVCLLKLKSVLKFKIILLHIISLFLEINDEIQAKHKQYFNKEYIFGSYLLRSFFFEKAGNGEFLTVFT